MEKDQTSSPPSELKGHIKGYKSFRVIPYGERYVSEDHTDLWTRLDDLYSIVQSYKTNFNKAKWVDCCYTFERTKFMGRLGHPECASRDIKDLIHQENLHSLEEFRRFMLKTLPRNDVGLIRMPQVNMKHGVLKEEADSSSWYRCDTNLQEQQEAKPSQTADNDVTENRACQDQELLDAILALKDEIDQQKVPFTDLVCNKGAERACSAPRAACL